MHETPAASMPSSLPALHECPQYLVDPRRRYASPCLVAVAQQAGELADCPIGTFIGGDPSRRGRDGSAGALVDEERGNDAGIWSLAGGEFEYRPLPLLLRRGCQQVEERLLFRPAQRGKAIQCCERARREMSTARDTTGAAVVEHNTAPEQRWGDTSVLLDAAVLHDGGDRIAFEFHLDLAGEPETASAGDRSSVEDATKVLRRERRRHRRALTLRGGRGEQRFG